MTFYCNGEPLGRVEDVELDGVDISDLKVWKDETFTTEVDTSGWTADMWKDVFGLIPIIQCKDCIYYDPPHIENDGKRYEYKDMPPEAFDPITHQYVSLSYGINMSGRCCRDYECGYSEDKRVFVPETNYCGRARRKEND